MTEKSYIVSLEDAEQIRAILLTHAEMSDQRSMYTEAAQGVAHPEDVASYQEEINQLTDDCNNLKRLADIFK